MTTSKTLRITLLFVSLLLAPTVRAEFEEDPNIEVEKSENNSLRQSSESSQSGNSSSWKNSSQSSHRESTRYKTTEKRKYFIDDEKRVDAGVFHVGFGVGGNFYTEPKFSKSTGQPLGEYFKDFGFQGGVYFDFDYEDMRLGLRGWVGYKYLLNSVHAFAFDGMIRYLFTMSDNVKFGVGVGASAGLWFRTDTVDTNEEVLFLPAFLIGAGFDFNPFLVDLKLLINRIGVDATLLGTELSFGVRL